MKRRLAIAVIGVALLLGISGNVKAEEFGYVRYELDCGTVCYDFGEWGYCSSACGETPEATCAVPEEIKTPAPTNTDAPEATPTDVPEVTPEATPKQKCNQGIGEGAENCDPGNSNHNQPSNDEGGRKPGTAGPRGR
jgi:hypothetical protein